MWSRVAFGYHANMRIALAVEYDGNGFCGWQRQPHCHAVQAELEHALGKIVNTPVTVHCAGRTDTGVHALAQVVHFDSPVERPLLAWTFGVNSHLDKRVAVHWAAPVPTDFHARFSALNRRYRYTIANQPTRPGLHFGRVSWVKRSLNCELMHSAAQCLVGEHDYSSFRSAECQADHARRNISFIRVERHGAEVVVDIQANGFLHNMVRIIIGCLLKVGTSDRPPAWLAEVLVARGRTQAGVTAPPHGLCFIQPQYPNKFSIPDFFERRQLGKF